jgi:hypothetical protein
MTISKYEEAIAKQSRHIIESALKPFLDKIKDLNNQLALQQEQSKSGDEEDNRGRSCI